MIHDWERRDPGAAHTRDKLYLAAKMPEASESHRTGRPVNQAQGSEDVGGNTAASEVGANCATAESSKMATPLKARKRTKTGCLSKSSVVPEHDDA